MTNPGPSDLPSIVASPLQKLRALDSPAFLVFVRSWWEGRARDVVVIWRQGDRTRVYCEAVGDVLGPGQPKVLKDTTLPATVCDSFVERAVALGLLDMRTQERPIIITHFDDHFAVCSPAGRNYCMVAGGQHERDPDMRLVDLVLEAVPTLPAFYARQQRPRR